MNRKVSARSISYTHTHRAQQKVGEKGKSETRDRLPPFDSVFRDLPFTCADRSRARYKSCCTRRSLEITKHPADIIGSIEGLLLGSSDDVYSNWPPFRNSPLVQLEYSAQSNIEELESWSSCGRKRPRSEDLTRLIRHFRIANKRNFANYTYYRPPRDNYPISHRQCSHRNVITLFSLPPPPDSSLFLPLLPRQRIHVDTVAITNRVICGRKSAVATPRRFAAQQRPPPRTQKNCLFSDSTCVVEMARNYRANKFGSLNSVFIDFAS